mmetsp:Transcript_17897/g.34029  ORF Transcript_17897/g.34029 Transcript_17897/m.34029 type:complete len:265 (+) Transcript_17897:341-1135(+)
MSHGILPGLFFGFGATADTDGIAFANGTFQNQMRQRIQQLTRQDSFQRTGPVPHIVTHFGENTLGDRTHIQRHALAVFKALGNLGNANTGNSVQIFALQTVENDGIIDTIQEFGAELMAYIIHDLGRHFGLGATQVGCQFGNQVGAHVGCHDNNAIAKVHLASVRIRQVTFIKELQQNIPNIGMPLFKLIQQQHLIRSSPYTLCQMPRIFVSNVTSRRTNESRNGMLFAIFAHINPRHGIFIVKQELGQRLGGFRFTHPCRTKE